MSQRYVDLSHTINDGMITYRGLPAPLICDYLSRGDSLDQYDDGSAFQIGQLTMVGNTGTYMDCPFHRFERGRDFSEIFLSNLVDLPGVLIRCHQKSSLSIEIGDVQKADLRGKAVLIRTDWSKRWGSDDYFEPHPFLTADAAQYLATQGVLLVGIDSYNVDDTRYRKRPVHTTLLSQNILIVEHLCQLHLVPDQDFLFSAAPAKITGMGSLPVRAYAKF